MRDPADSIIADAVSLTLRLPPVIHAELKALAEATGKSLNSTIVAAVREKLDADAAKAPPRRRHLPGRAQDKAAPPRGARPWASRSAPPSASGS